VPLARYQRVHLRNLLRWEVPPRPRDKGKSRVILHAIAMEKIRLHLNANAPAVLELRNAPWWTGMSIRRIRRSTASAHAPSGARTHGQDARDLPRRVAGSRGRLRRSARGRCPLATHLRGPVSRPAGRAGYTGLPIGGSGD
jgi:hypothetical protein